MTFKPIESQEDLDRIIAERVNREKAKFVDYEDLKQQVASFDQVVSEKDTEIVSLKEQLGESKKLVESSGVSALRYKIALEHKVGLEDAELFLTGSDEDSLHAQAKRLGERVSQPNGAPYSPGEKGNPPPPPQDQMEQFVSNLFERART